MARSPAVFPALITLAAVLFGFILGAVSCGSALGPSAPPIEAALSPPGEDPNLAALLREVRALGDRISAIAVARPTAPASEPASSRTPVEGSEMVTVTELSRLLEHCTALVERLEQRTRGEERRDLSRVTPSASRERFIDYSRGADAYVRITRDHLLWSYQQILDRYGLPDGISTDSHGGIYWRYVVTFPGSAENTMSFLFADGLVIRGDL